MKSVQELSAAELEAELAHRKEAEKARREAAEVNELTAAFCQTLSPIGVWEVSTEGDAEGKSSRSLGTYEGHVADIAAQLAQRTTGSLTFKLVSPTKAVKLAAGGDVAIHVHSQPYRVANLRKEARARFMAGWLKSQPSEYDVQAELNGPDFYATGIVTLTKK